MPQTILVVDDEPSVVKYVTTLLERSGYLVVPALGPHEALAAFAKSSHSIALLLTDIVMPEMNGLELVKRLRKMRPKLPYVLMTGFSTEALLEHYNINLEGGPLLRKPFTAEALLVEIRKSLP